MTMSKSEYQTRLRLRDDFKFYAKHCLKIRTKEGEILPFVINRAQDHILACAERQRLQFGKIRCNILKGRQQGCSTMIEGRFYWRVTHNKGMQAFILTHSEDATRNLFKMAQRYHANCPPEVRPNILASNAKELLFGYLDSGYALGTAGNKSVGRSSTIQLLHGSEVAYWANASEHAKGILQAVPDAPGTEIFLESTANGVGDFFHNQWQTAESGKSDYINIFVPWYWQDEYQRDELDRDQLDDDEDALIELYGLSRKQLSWRRYKIADLSVGGLDGRKAFQQEYPCTPIEAFQMSGDDNLIDPNVVAAARKCDVNSSNTSPLIVGVDPARFGDDRTSIIRRKGRVAFGLQSYIKKDAMEIVGIIHKIIIDEQPHKVLIDGCNLGCAIYDRLKELGYGDVCSIVKTGSAPLDDTRYFNKRAELWGQMNEWLIEYPCQVPDLDSLHADLCAVKYTFDSKTRLKIERKEDMKGRGIRSPDEADALALTFSLPKASLVQDKKLKDQEKAKLIMGNFLHQQNLRNVRHA